MTDSLDEKARFLVETAPYRAFLYRFWRDFFLGRRDSGWRSRMPDALKIAAVLAAGRDLPEETPLANPLDGLAPADIERPFAALFYGVGPETFPLTKSGAAAPGALSAGPASARAHAVFRAYGLVLTGENLPEDHIGVSLEFLAQLAEANHPHESPFLDEAVLSWLPSTLSAAGASTAGLALRPLFNAAIAALEATDARLKERQPQRI